MNHEDHPLAIAELGRYKWSWGYRVKLTWREFLTRAVRCEERSDKDGPGFVPALLQLRQVPPPPLDPKKEDKFAPARRAQCNAHRCNMDVIQNHLLCLDLDKIAASEASVTLDEIWERLAIYEWYAHTTHSHTPHTPRWRVILPLAQPVPGGEWKPFWFGAVTLLTGDAAGRIAADPQVNEPSRFYYWSSCLLGAERLRRYHMGALLDPVEVPRLKPAGMGARGQARNAPAEGAVIDVDGPPILDGQRNVALRNICRALRGEGWGEAEIDARLHAINLKRCRPPITPEDGKDWIDLCGMAARVVQRFAPGEPMSIGDIIDDTEE